MRRERGERSLTEERREREEVVVQAREKEREGGAGPTGESALWGL